MTHKLDELNHKLDELNHKLDELNNKWDKINQMGHFEVLECQMCNLLEK